MKSIDDVIKGLLYEQRKSEEDFNDNGLLPDDQAKIVSLLDDFINTDDRKKK
jgi:hypothetical protein